MPAGARGLREQMAPQPAARPHSFTLPPITDLHSTRPSGV